MTTEDGQKNPADTDFDDTEPVNEAGITVTFHAGDAAYDFMFAHWGLSTEFKHSI